MSPVAFKCHLTAAASLCWSETIFTHKCQRFSGVCCILYLFFNSCSHVHFEAEDSDDAKGGERFFRMQSVGDLMSKSILWNKTTCFSCSGSKVAVEGSNVNANRQKISFIFLLFFFQVLSEICRICTEMFLQKFYYRNVLQNMLLVQEFCRKCQGSGPHHPNKARSCRKSLIAQSLAPKWYLKHSAQSDKGAKYMAPILKPM